MTIKEALQFSKSNNIDNFDARQLLELILNVDKDYIIINNEHELDDEQEKTYLIYLGQLVNGKPLQYITKKQYFMENEFYVDENVLIPQPDTEVLVEQALKIINTISKNIKNNNDNNKENEKIKILDLCTGSGAIAISILKEIEKRENKKDKNEKNKKTEIEVEIIATDISEKAIEISKQNEKKILAANKITFIQSDMFEKINIKDFDIIVSNPPYIKTEEINFLSKDVQAEPIIALDGGEDGLEFYRIIKENIVEYLNKNGYLLMEIGFDQKESVQKMFKNSECIKDYSGNDRVIIWRKV